MDGEVPLEDEIPTVFDLIDRVVAAQVYGLAILLRKLGREKPTPVVQALLDEGSAQLVGSRLQRLRVCGGEKRIVVFAKRHSLAAEFDLHEVVPVQVIRCLKGKVRAAAPGQRTDHRITDVEVVMQEAGWDAPDNAVVRVIGGKPRHLRTKRAAHLHASEDAVDPVLIPALHALQMRADTVLLAHAFFGLHNGDLVIARIAFYPSPIFRGCASPGFAEGSGTVRA